MRDHGLRYKWRKTWADTENDFACWEDGESIARIYLHHDGRWLWFMNAWWLPGRSGVADEPREAARLAEAAYDETTVLETERKANKSAE